MFPCPPRCPEGNIAYCADPGTSPIQMSELFGDGESIGFNYTEYIKRFVKNPLRVDLGYITKDVGGISYAGQMCKNLLEELIDQDDAKKYYKFPDSSTKGKLFIGYDREPVQERYIADLWNGVEEATFDQYIYSIVSQVQNDSQIYPKIGGNSIRLRNGASFFTNSATQITFNEDEIVINANCAGGQHNITIIGLEAEYQEGMADGGARHVGARAGKCEGSVFAEARIVDNKNYIKTNMLVAN